MKKTKPKNTQATLAKILGVSRQTISHHVKTGKAPKSLDDIDAWLTHLAAYGTNSGIPKEMRKAIAKQRERLLRAQADRAELDLSERRKEVIAFAEVNRFVSHLVANVFFGSLDRLSFELPSTLKGRGEVEIHRVLTHEIEMVKKELMSATEEMQKLGK